MTAGANALGGASGAYVPMHPELDSELTNAICSSPIFGVLFSIFRDNAVQSSIHETDNVPALIEMIDMRKRHITANLSRDLRDIALVTTGVALRVFDTQLCWLTLLQMVDYPIQIAIIKHNEKVRKALLETRDPALRTNIW